MCHVTSQPQAFLSCWALNPSRRRSRGGPKSWTRPYNKCHRGKSELLSVAGRGPQGLPSEALPQRAPPLSKRYSLPKARPSRVPARPLVNSSSLPGAPVALRTGRLTPRGLALPYLHTGKPRHGQSGLAQGPASAPRAEHTDTGGVTAEPGPRPPGLRRDREGPPRPLRPPTLARPTARHAVATRRDTSTCFFYSRTQRTRALICFAF